MVYVKINAKENSDLESISAEVDTNIASVSFMVGLGETNEYNQLQLTNINRHTVESLLPIWEQFNNVKLEDIETISVIGKNNKEIFNSEATPYNITYLTEFSESGIAETITFLFEK